MNREHIEQNYQEALRRIQEAKETRATSLDLTGFIWDRIPSQLFELTWLEELQLQPSREPGRYVREIFLLPENFSCLNQLRVLIIGRLGLKSLAPLASLTELTILDCGGNQLTDLAPVTSLPQLSSLNCSYNQLRDLTPLGSLTKLTTLACGFNQLTNLFPLSSLNRLTSLSCQANSKRDFSPLATLPNFISINCSDNRLTELSSVASLTKLTFLRCGNNPLTDLAPLTSLTQLTSLDCSYNQLSNLIPLGFVEQLTALECWGNRVADLAPLANLSQLTFLNCGNNQLTDLSPLAALTQLTTLDCRFNQLTDLAVLKTLVLNGQIQKLQVFNNPVLGIPRELLGTGPSDNVATALREYWLDVEQGSEPNRDVKVLLVGNGCVGKSTLAHGLRTGAAPPIPISERTHAIEIELLEVPLSSDGPDCDGTCGILADRNCTMPPTVCSAPAGRLLVAVGRRDG